MDQLPYIHPHLTIDESPTKGRLVRATSAIKRREIILKDAPYALVPALLIDQPPFLLCNRHECSRRIPHKQIHPSPEVLVRCTQRCLPEAVWCNDECRSRDRQRHELECLWLKKTSREIRSAYGDSEFVLLWLIIRILINRYLKEKLSTHPSTPPSVSGSIDQNITNAVAHDFTQLQQSTKWLGSHFSRRGWESVWNLEGDFSFFSADKIEHWRTMTSNYICNGILPLKYPLDDIVKVICKVELNSFGLYPGVTGQYPVISTEGRGDYYGGGVYPTAAMFNHACCPNVTHELDESGRRIFRAGRNIEVGEECCISYFDLAEYPGSTARKEAITTSWDFTCDCRRCEEDMEVPGFLQALDLDI